VEGWVVSGRGSFNCTVCECAWLGWRVADGTDDSDEEHDVEMAPMFVDSAAVLAASRPASATTRTSDPGSIQSLWMSMANAAARVFQPQGYERVVNVTDVEAGEAAGSSRMSNAAQASASSRGSRV
jgi:hypothetical protein